MAKTPKTDSGIARAVAKYKSQEALADEVGVKKQAVQQWVAKGYVPLDRVEAVAELTGVPREDLIDPKIKAVIGAPKRQGQTPEDAGASPSYKKRRDFRRTKVLK